MEIKIRKIEKNVADKLTELAKKKWTLSMQTL